MVPNAPVRFWLLFCLLILPQVPASALISTAGSVAYPATLTSSVNVLTQHNDNMRTGANLQETVLNPSSVTSASFGLLFSRPVSGHVYAQPLYASNLTMSDQTVHNVIFVATMHNDIYAFDADDPNADTPLWQKNLGPSAVLASSPEIRNACGGNYKDIQVEVGTVSTPVIDLSSNTIYVVALTKDSVTGVYKHTLHALDIASGNPKQTAIQVQGSFPKTGGETIVFSSTKQLQRSSLLLHDGKVYFAFAAYCDDFPYNGWVFGYNAANIQNSPLTYNTTPYENWRGGGIWQSGQGLSVDSDGNLFLMTGNGLFDGDTGGPDRGSSFIKLSSNLNYLDSFTPYNQDFLSANDMDLGSSGVLILPGTKLALGGGKEGKLYLVDRYNLGGYQQGSGGGDGVVQSWQAVNPNSVSGAPRHVHGSPVLWDSPDGRLVYVWGESDYIRAYKFVPDISDPLTGTFQTTSVATGTVRLPDWYMPGAMLSVSANGSGDGTGILWASRPTNSNANDAVVTGTLQALDASDISKELWNSDAAVGGHDKVGFFAKFAAPTVVNGKIYLPTFSDPNITTTATSYIRAYGLLKGVVTNPLDQGQGQDANNAGTLSYSLSNSGSGDRIYFKPSDGQNIVTVTGTLPVVPAGVTLQGFCNASGPGITIQGISSINGLVLGGGDQLIGLLIQGFKGPQLKATGGSGANQLFCVKAHW